MFCCGLFLSVSPAHAQDATSLPLLFQDDMTYLGAFPVPLADNANEPLHHGGQALSYNATNDSLFFGCHDWYQKLAEISIPASFSSTASVLQNCVDITEGALDDISPGNDKPGGRSFTTEG